MLTHREWAWLVQCQAASPYSLGWSLRLLNYYDAFGENSGNRTWPAATYKPNHVGLFGLYANIGEWCADGSDKERVVFTYNYTHPRKSITGILEINRTTPELYFYSMGFRVARSIPAQPSSN